MKLAAIQHDIEWEDPSANQARLAPRIVEAVQDGADLVLLTEMFATGFSMATERITESPEGPTSTFLTEIAGQVGAWVGGSIAIREPGHERPTNCFTLAGPAGEVHRYAKIHPFSYANEHEHYEPGTNPITVEVAGVRVSPLICYDLRFADLFWELAPVTDCYLVPANWPAARRQHWMALLVARAIENQAYVVGVNRVGSAGQLDYAGDSRIIDPLGHELAAAEGGETTLSAHIDPDKVAAVRSDFPFLADRRPQPS